MKQEDKELLLKDLCARLPYGVKYECSDIKNVWKLNSILTERRGGSTFLDIYNPLELCKPYLFPLSSMTEEQKKEYDSIIYHNIELHCERYYNIIDVDCYEELHDFYHKNHLDYRNLIGNGLAIDATGLNIY